jgi:NAD+ synthase
MEAAIQAQTRNFSEVKQKISEWLKNYIVTSNQKGYVIGVSGGIDSAVCSTLCAMTGFPLLVVKMSIHQAHDEADRGEKHINWLKKTFPNVKSMDIDLSSVYDEQMRVLQHGGAFTDVDTDSVFLTSSNTRSRLRMVTLYGLAGAHKFLVCGTGNKVEDYGIGFFTKFGDGGVDVSPIGELTKTEVYALGKEMGVIEEILNARPTDGLWADGRTDEDQIGATYPELEWAMKEVDSRITLQDIQSRTFVSYGYSERELIVLDIYLKRHQANMHKMSMPPICNLD